ncbi:MAG: metal ABC transporter ATP-binding protein [Candidatus Eremiobacteraeota bacterium]|nr:metal ABC transporter ATP-binding protein [Candidatus Eremiobacteraeota bacterium]
MENGSTVIRLRDVDLSIKGRSILEHITMDIQAGSFLAIIGPNGAGKSTLLRLILGLMEPTSGTIEVLGREPRHLGALRHNLAYVPQIVSVDLRFPVRVEDAVLMGRYGRIGLFRRPGREDREIVRETMEKVGIAPLARVPLSRLSGGQLQRVFIARALANEPTILFLDEPTSGVDQVTTFNLYELLSTLHSEKMTILLVSHDVGVVANFVDGVACLNRRLIMHGKPEDVLTSHTLEDMYGCDAVFFHHGKVPHMVVEERR